jgi:Rps23 Pro-64 3,4-dihydroxylase Tpa1-like proline 4-hydroxylase
MEDMGATKELTQAMMDTIAKDVGESSNARVTSRQLFADLKMESQCDYHVKENNRVIQYYLSSEDTCCRKPI